MQPKHLIYILVPFFINLALAETITLSNEQLPYQGYLNLTLYSQENTTTIISQTLFNESINLTYPTEIYFNNTNQSTIQINYSIPTLTLTENTTTFNTEITFSTSLSNTTYPLQFIITREPIVTEYSYNNYSMLNGGYELNISTDLLPISGSFNFTIKGEENSTINLFNCSEWLSCPYQITLNASKMNLEIAYYLPYGIENGTYERTFYLNYSNITKIGLIRFNVVEPNMSFEHYVFPDYCYAGGNDTIKLICALDQEAFLEQKMQELLNYRYQTWKKALVEISKKNCTSVKEVEKLVMTGSIDADLKKLYDQCVIDKVNCNNDFTKCSILNVDLINEKSKFDLRLNEMETNITIREQTINDTINLITAEKKKTIKRVMIGTLIALLAIAICTYLSFKNKSLNGKWWWEA